MKAARNTLLALAAVLAALAAYLGYRLYEADKELAAKEGALSVSTASGASLEEALAAAKDENARLSEALEGERRRNDAFEEKIDSLSGTVGKLDKLSRLDPELLSKYSKVFFLNDNYVPSALTLIPDAWTYGGQEEYFHKEAWPFLEEMLEDAKEDGIELRVVSGYRSFGTQAILKSGYTVRYGAGANAFSADQGYSEHQLGTTLDFTTEDLGAAWSSSFEGSEAYGWLTENAHKYGFVLSYPEGNSYYVFEPWHWRFVGERLADDLREGNKHFYDLDQRDIDTYLIDIFE